MRAGRGEWDGMAAGDFSAGAFAFVSSLLLHPHRLVWAPERGPE